MPVQRSNEDQAVRLDGGMRYKIVWVGNLCTIGFGRFHLHANVARFERANKPVKPLGPSQSNAHGTFGSFVSAARDFHHDLPLLSVSFLTALVSFARKRLCILTINNRFIDGEIQGVCLYIGLRNSKHGANNSLMDGAQNCDVVETGQTSIRDGLQMEKHGEYARVVAKVLLDHSQEVHDFSYNGESVFPFNKVNNGGLFLTFWIDMVRVGQFYGLYLDGCHGKRTKKEWVKELIVKHRINCLALQETKDVIVFLIWSKVPMGNSNFVLLHSDSLGNSWVSVIVVLFLRIVVHRRPNRIGCAVLNTPFRYLGVTVGECMSRKSAWVGLVNKLQARLSKWKVKTLSIGGRLTLLKSVLGASPIYYMSIFKVPKGVLKTMESIRSKFFNGVDSSG
ncbi:hypothetical protein Tco_0747041 [Tanacetum coccineum]